MTIISPEDGTLSGGPSMTRTVLQNEAAECGLACLAMISSALGHQVTLAELRRRFSVSAKGVNLRSLMDMADTIGLAARPLRLEIEDISQLKIPAILHWNLNHFIVLERQKGSRYLIHDPARGRRWLDREELSRSFTGVALELTRTPDFVRRDDPERVRLGDLFRRVRGLVPSMVQMFILAAVMQLFALLSPILNQLVIDEAITKGDAGLLTVLAGGMLLLLLTTTAVRLLQGFVGLYMGTQMSFQLQTNMLRHVLRLPVSWFEKRHVGDVLSRFGSLQPVQDVLLNSVTLVVLNILVGVLSLAMMLVYSPLLTLLETGSVIMFFIIRLATFPYVRRKTEEGLHLDAVVQSTFLETIRGARTFKMFGHERDRVATWQNEQARLINNRISLSKFGLFGGAGTSLLGGVQQIIVWFIGAKMVINGDLTLGMLFAFQAYTSQFGGATSVLITQTFTFRTMKLHLERLSDIIHADEEKGLEVAVDPRRPPMGAIYLHNVSFRYAEHEPWVFDQVSLTIEPGEFLCLVGPSGQGKTTLLKILLGFYDPQVGEVLIGSTPLRRFGIRSFRSRIGVVLQDDQLFAGTIFDNIAFFEAEADTAAVEAAARAAAIHDEINALPMGYQTFTGDLGSTLSGGQRQRLLLARALYRQPDVLLLDEGTANLDPASERAVMDVIRDLSITRIVVAHRDGASLGATRFCDVREGKVTELASHSN